MNDENILLSTAADLYSLCEKRGCPVFSHFYDGGEQAILTDGHMLRPESLLFGGHENCERKILGVFPEWEEPDENAFPIKLIKITSAFKKDFTHRDYLGSLMGLGIERNRIGDIVVADDGAYIFLHSSIADYVLLNLKKIGSQGVKVAEFFEEFLYPEGKFVLQNVVAASMRSDAVLAAALNISRNKAVSLIEHEKVNINHRPVKDGSNRVNVGDLFSVRGFGRFLITEISGETRSGRLHLSLKKYL